MQYLLCCEYGKIYSKSVVLFWLFFCLFVVLVEGGFFFFCFVFFILNK